MIRWLVGDDGGWWRILLMVRDWEKTGKEGRERREGGERREKRNSMDFWFNFGDSSLFYLFWSYFELVCFDQYDSKLIVWFSTQLDKVDMVNWF